MYIFEVEPANNALSGACSNFVKLKLHLERLAKRHNHPRKDLVMHTPPLSRDIPKQIKLNLFFEYGQRRDGAKCPY